MRKSYPSAPRSINPAGGAFGDGAGAEPGFFRDEGDGAVLEEEAGDAGRTGAMSMTWYRSFPLICSSTYVQSGHVGIP